MYLANYLTFGSLESSEICQSGEYDIEVSANPVSATRGRASQPKVLAMTTDCSATCQQGYVQPR